MQIKLYLDYNLYVTNAPHNNKNLADVSLESSKKSLVYQFNNIIEIDNNVYKLIPIGKPNLLYAL